MSGTVTFGQSRVPALQSGVYTITVEHLVVNHDPAAQDSKAQAYIDHTFSSVNRFAVTGARFALAPNLVHSVFPPADSRGEYDDVLAHVVLANSTLPWQRTVGHDGGTWLAVLVFHPDDGVGESVTAHIGDLVRAGGTGSPNAGFALESVDGPPLTLAGPLPADAVSYPDLTLEPGESWTDTCRVIDVPVGVFSAIAPAAVDLAWLTHVRTVESADAADDDGTFSVVVSNRLGRQDADCVAHLVSLENLADILPTVAADGSYAPASITVAGGPDAGRPAATVRLVSLKSWSFRPTEPTETFDGFLEHVDRGPLQRPVKAVTDSPGVIDAAVANAFNMGYTALDHHTRLGDRTVTWVRGPLLPFDIGDGLSVPLPDPGTAAITTADAAMRYDPTTGMFDASYAAAWQIGRLLAVQNLSFASALYDWKRAVARATMQAVEREYLESALGATAPGVASADHGLDVVHAVMQVVATHVAPDLADHTGSTVVDRSVSLRPRRTLFERHTAVLADTTALAAIHADTELPDEVSAWLNRLARLNGVPFNYLVPDEAMLPVESVRFFHVDPSWIAALLEGAMSIGTSTAGDAVHEAVLRPHVLAATAQPAPYTGLLLRSGVVAGWPKLKLAGYDAEGSPLRPVRADVLSPTILLAVFVGVVARVDLMEPPLGLHFGVRADKDLRWVTVPPQAPAGARPGDEIVGSSPGAPPTRADPSTLAVATYAGRLAGVVDAAHANDLPGSTTPRPFTAAEFSLQLVEGVDQFRFIQSPGQSPNQSSDKATDASTTGPNKGDQP